MDSGPWSFAVHKLWCIGASAGSGRLRVFPGQAMNAIRRLEPVRTAHDGDIPMRATVLLVNEEPELLDALSRFLDGLGFQVASASSGHEAFKRVQKEEFDVVVIDLLMKETDPVGLLRQIKNLLPLTEVILMVNKETIASAANGMRLGAFDFVLTSEVWTELPYKILMGKTRKTLQEDKIRLTEESLAEEAALRDAW
jgi:DNA-binding NtrC family response regulator